MRNEISITEVGKTVDEAIDKACIRLGCNREDSDWEIIDLPKKSFFGLKFTPAKVRVTIEMPEEQKVVEKTAKTEIKPVPKEEKAFAVKDTKKEPEKVVSKPKAEPMQAPVVKKEVPKKAEPFRETRAEAHNQPIDKEKVEVATRFVKDILDAMDMKYTMETKETANGLLISVKGDELGAIIGRRGETLDSLQYLTSLATNRSEGEFLRVTIDCGSYRLKREQTLVELARKTADQVLKTNISKALEPMTAGERRLIHSTIADIEGALSISVGSDPYRRVVVKTPTSSSPRSRSDSSSRPPRRDGSSSKPPKRNYDKASSNTQKADKITNPAKDKVILSETPLYGKIDLD